jgi:hypothetical protein
MIIEDNLGHQGDALYSALMQTHDGLTPNQSHALNARLVLLMMNEIGNPDTIIALMADARTLTQPGVGPFGV